MMATAGLVTKPKAVTADELVALGERQWDRLGNYGFMTVVGLALCGTASSEFGAIVTLYGFTRFTITLIRWSRTVLRLRTAVIPERTAP